MRYVSIEEEGKMLVVMDKSNLQIQEQLFFSSLFFELVMKRLNALRYSVERKNGHVLM